MDFYIALALVALFTFCCGLLPIAMPSIKRHTWALVPLSAGLLVGTAMLHLLPEAIEVVGKSVGFSMIAGFALFYLPQKFMMAHPCDEEDCRFHNLGMLAFIGLSLHTFMDGVGLGAVTSTGDLDVVSLAIIGHKLPAALALSFMLIASGGDKKRNIVLMALFAISTPIGAIITHHAIGALDEIWLGHALSFSAGNFLAIAGSDLLRRLHEHGEKNKIWRIAAIFAGALLTLLFGE